MSLVNPIMLSAACSPLTALGYQLYHLARNLPGWRQQHIYMTSYEPTSIMLNEFGAFTKAAAGAEAGTAALHPCTWATGATTVSALWSVVGG